MRYYDRNGELLDDVLRWARRMDEPEYVHVALTMITSEADPDMAVVVSTQWTGLDPATGILGPERPALIFETMALYQATQDIMTDKWATESATRIGHAELVALVVATMPDATVVELDAFGRPASAATWVGAPLPPPSPTVTRS